MVALAKTRAIRYHRPAPIREKTRLLPPKPTHGALPDQKDADAATHTSAPTRGPRPHTKKTGAGGPSPPGRVAEHSAIPRDARTVAHTQTNTRPLALRTPESAGGPSPPGRGPEHSEIPGDARTVAHTLPTPTRGCRSSANGKGAGGS